MENIDYSKIGFKAGLEIHQQLDTNKLFSHAPSILKSDKPDKIIVRKLHVVAGESGEIDEAAKYQASLDKEFVYEIHNGSTSLVELDEEPPHEINEEALKISLQIALLLNCKIQPLTQIMRKTVIDGSNTGGFQRTVMIARDGWIDSSYGRVGIDSVCLEEDSARKIKEEEGRVFYRLDRLGIPLIEIATAPDIKNPEQVKESALKIGEILRSCKVKRGIGTIRQDVNVSVSKGDRVEIKGFQDPSMMVQTVNKEIERQLELVKNKKKVEKEVRRALPSGETEFLRPMPGSARMYPETDLPLLKISLDLINLAKKTLPKLREEIEEELRKQGLSHEMIKLLLKRNMVEEYKELLNHYDSPQFVSKILLVFPREISSKEKLSEEEVEEKMSIDVLIHILDNVNNKTINESDVKHVLEKIVSGVEIENALKVEKADINEIEEKIHNLIKSKPGLNPNAYMGLVMKEFKGRINGKEAIDIIMKFVK
jgi:Glu-tRNA(Gln) amidotransferase subunit E-like FAD-binding protein